PDISSSASTTMDLPAPVSPVSAVKPDFSSSSAWSTRTRSRNCRCVSMGLVAVAAVIGRAVRTAAPMQFRAQQPVIVVTRRMQQGNLSIRRLDIQVVALFEGAERRTVAGDLGARLEAIRHAQLDFAPRPHHDGTVAQGMRTDGGQHPHIEIGLDDGAA